MTDVDIRAGVNGSFLVQGEAAVRVVNRELNLDLPEAESGPPTRLRGNGRSRRGGLARATPSPARTPRSCIDRSPAFPPNMLALRSGPRAHPPRSTRPATRGTAARSARPR